jgi:hypothetical protein
MSTVSIVRQQNDNVEAAVRKSVSLTPAFDSVQWKEELSI